MTVDPCFAELLADPRNHVRPLPQSVPLDYARAAADARLAAAPKEPVHSVSDIAVPAAQGAIACRLYRPEGTDGQPVVVFFHGGGWVWGSLDSHDSVCRSLAVSSGCAVLSVAYRLSPEAPYPAALEDCLAVLDWVAAHAGDLDLGPGISLAGDSSGAHLALATALQSAVPVRHLALFYPPLDPACASASQQAFAQDHLLTREGMLWFWDCYRAGKNLPALLEADLSALPPTSIGLAECDILHDEGEDLFNRLRDSGVQAKRRTYPGMIHAFISLPHITPVARTALHAMGRDIRDALFEEPPR
ncbi:alpha/beta hydrolase [Sulfitobacter sp. HNIBRBA3233]|uniref:alpha/beta hydrolase n=1 Tax=Sulfitobacter marinivivus TaxID=3158558 RepID=UPI0032DFF623